MSTPSSRLVLVTTAFSSPALSDASTARRRSASSAEWCAATASGPTPSSWRRSCVTFSVKARVLAKTTVVRASPVASRSLPEQPAIGQAPMRRLVGLEERLDLEGQVGRALGPRGLDDPAGPGRADQEPRHRLGRPAGRREADAAGSRRARAASRSSETARSAPRLFGTSAWTSSTIRWRTPRQSVVPGRPG